MSDTNFLHTIKPSQNKYASAKLFQLTSLSCALALAGCGGDGTVDAIAPKPDLGVTGGNGGSGSGGTGSGNTGGDNGTTQPTKEPAFYIQKLTPSLENIKLTAKQETQEITVVVKALQKKTAGAMAGKEVTLAVIDSEKLGISIAGNSTQTTGADGNATYKLVFNPKAVTDEALLLKGINLTATAKAQDGSVVEQFTKIGVSKEGSTGSVVESKLQITSSLTSATLLSDGEINARGDTVTVSVQAKQTNGVAVEDVDITLGIGSYKGVSIIDGGKKKTNSSGEAQFTLVVDSNLSDDERKNLIQKSITYYIKLIEEDGAEKSDTGTWKVTNPVSSYDVSITGNAERLSTYGDKQTLTIKAVPKTGKVLPIQGSTVKVTLNDTAKLPKGVSLSSDLVVLNEQGQATLDLVVPKGLSTEEKKYLEDNGISYTLTLTEPNHADTSITVTSEAYIPEAQYQVSVDSVDKKAISSAGGSTQISFRVNNKNNGSPVVGQKVVANLPEIFVKEGLVTLDNAAEQTTNSQGIVTYTVRIPTGLNEEQLKKLKKRVLEKEELKLVASVAESTGVTTQVESENITVNLVTVEDIKLTSKVSVETANAQGDSFTIAVSAVRAGGAAVIGELIKLQLDNVKGVRITGGDTQQTNEQGIATFTLRVDNGLTQEQREELVTSGINYTAVLTASDGTQYELKTQNIKVNAVTVEFKILNKKDEYEISNTGGSQELEFQLLSTDNNTPVRNQAVNFVFDNPALAKLLTINGASGASVVTANTNNNGFVSFDVLVPSNLTTEQRSQLEGQSLQATVTETLTGNQQTATVTVNPIVSDEIKLEAEALSELNLNGGETQIRVVAQDKQGYVVSGQSISMALPSSLAQLGFTIVSNATQTTDSSGVATFTIAAPNNLTLKQKKKYEKSGLVIAFATRDANNNSSTATAAVSTTAQKKSDITLSSNLKSSTLSAEAINAYGDEVTISVQAKKPDGAAAQGETVVLGIANYPGVTILEGNKKQTNANGIATFKLVVSSNLSKQERTALVQSGITYNLTLTEENGDIASEPGIWEVKAPTSDYNLAVLGNTDAMSAYGDTQQLQITTTAKSASVPTSITGSHVQIALNNSAQLPTGVRLSQNTVTLDKNGQAKVNLIIPDNLTATERQKISSGISYTLTLTEPNRATTVETVTSSVYIPEAQYKVSIDSIDKKALSSTGGITHISFRVNNKDTGAPVVGQKVVASLPKELVEKGVVTLDTASEQTTNELGIVTYAVRIPTGLNDTQLQNLVGPAAIGLKLTVVITESTGVKTEEESDIIKIDSVEEDSIQLTSQASKEVANALGDTFTIAVSAAKKDGSAVIGEPVKLQLKDIPASVSSKVRIIGDSTQQTNEQGVATFTLRVDSGLTTKQKEDLVISGIKYTALLTASDGVQYQLKPVEQTVTVAKKGAVISIESTPSQTQISELGGSANIVVKVTPDSTTTDVVGKEVRMELSSAARQAGVTLVSGTAITDKDGLAIFVVNVPEGLSPAVRKDLVDNKIKYQVSYANDGIMADPYDGTIKVTAVTVDFSALNSTSSYEINITGGSQEIAFQLFSTDATGNKTPVRNQAVNFVFDNPALAKLLTINGASGASVVTANTNNNGFVSFDVLVPSNLTTEQRSQLEGQSLQATVTETLTGNQQTATVTVKSIESEIKLEAEALSELNLNGGETQIRVVAKNKEDNVVAGQTVAMALPASLAKAGLMIASSPTQTTDNSGVAIFTIAAPNNLTSGQKDTIEGDPNVPTTYRSFEVDIATRDANNNSTIEQVNVATLRPTDPSETISTIVANKVVDSKGDTFKVFVRVEGVDKDGKKTGQAITGREVTLNIKDPIQTGVSFTGSNKATTNSQGVAEFDLQLVPGDFVDLSSGIKVEASAVSGNGVRIPEKPYNIPVDQRTISDYIIMGFADKTELNTGGDQTNITFRVVDKNGGALSDVPVQLRIKDAEVSGAALTTKSELITDEQGLVQAGLVLGAGSVYARLNHGITVVGEVLKPEYSVLSDGTTTVSMVAQKDKEVNLYASGTNMTLTASKTNLKTNDNVTFTTTIIDGAGNPVADAPIEWVNISDPENPTVINTIIASQNTDRDGKITSDEVNESALPFDSNGNLKVAARVKGSDALSNNITLVQVSQAGISFNEILPEYEVNNTHTINIQIRAKDAADALNYVNKEVTVETSLGSFANGIPSGSKVIEKVTITQAMIDTTDNSIINVPVKLSSGLAGTAVLTASVTNTTGNKQTTTVDTYFRATTPAKMLLQPVRSVIVPGGSTEVVALVKDKNDVPVKGVVVVFSRTKDSSTGRLSAATATTNEKGEARVVYTANAVSPIDGIEIHAQLLEDTSVPPIGTKTTTITVSKDAVYTTLAFSDKIESSGDNIYYFVAGSIAVMDGSGRPVKNTEVSLKSYATAYRQGLYCTVERNISYQPKEETKTDGTTTTVTVPDVQEFSSVAAEKFASGWQDTEDANWNYILDNNEDKNNSKKLEAINPVTILGTNLADDKYTFVTDDEGKVDFRIRYPKAYSNWTQVRFDATTLLNGSENLQSFDIELPAAINDFSLSGDTIITPYTNNTSAFGVGSQVCISQLSISVDARAGLEGTTVAGVAQGVDSNKEVKVYKENSQVGLGNVSEAQPRFKFDFGYAFDKGSLVTVQVGSSHIRQVIKTKK